MKSIHKAVSVGTAFVMFYTTVAVPIAQANLWSERREALSNSENRKNPSQYQLASLPASLPAFDISQSLTGIRKAGYQNQWSLGAARRVDFTGLPTGLQTLPSAYGEIRKTHVNPGSKGPFIVLIQDAHELESAQRNISAMLGHLAKAGQNSALLIGVVGTEGAYEIDKYRSEHDAKALRIMADFMLRKSLINGPEFFALTSDNPAPIWGIENRPQYLRHVQSYREGLKASKEISQWIMSQQSSIAERESKVLTRELSDLNRIFDEYAVGKRDLSLLLLEIQKIYTVSERSFPQISRYLQALKMEESLDFMKVESERAEIIGKLARELTPKDLQTLARMSLAYRVGQVSHSAYYYFLSTCLATHKLTVYKQFNEYMDYVFLSSRIVPDDIFDEIDALKTLAFERLIKTKAQKVFIQECEDLRSVKKMVSHEMSPEEWARFKTVGVAEPFKPFQDFYEAALARNRSLTENFVSKIQSMPPPHPEHQAFAVLIAGGFHTPGLEKEFEKLNFSYAVVTPKIGQVRKGTEYLNFFSESRTPLQKMLLGEKIFMEPTSGLAANPMEGFELVAEADRIVLQAGASALDVYLGAQIKAAGIKVAEESSASGARRFKVIQGGRTTEVDIASQGSALPQALGERFEGTACDPMDPNESYAIGISKKQGKIEQARTRLAASIEYLRLLGKKANGDLSLTDRRIAIRGTLSALFTIGYLFSAAAFFPFIETFIPAFGMMHGGWIWFATGLISSSIHTATEWKARALEHGKDAWKARVTDFLIRFVQYQAFSLPFAYQSDFSVAFIQSFELHALMNMFILAIRAFVKYARSHEGLSPALRGLGNFLRPIAAHARLGMMEGDKINFEMYKISAEGRQKFLKELEKWEMTPELSQEHIQYILDSFGRHWNEYFSLRKALPKNVDHETIKFIFDNFGKNWKEAISLMGTRLLNKNTWKTILLARQEGLSILEIAILLNGDIWDRQAKILRAEDLPEREQAYIMRAIKAGTFPRISRINGSSLVTLTFNGSEIEHTTRGGMEISEKKPYLKGFGFDNYLELKRKSSLPRLPLQNINAPFSEYVFFTNYFDAIFSHFNMLLEQNGPLYERAREIIEKNDWDWLRGELRLGDIRYEKVEPNSVFILQLQSWLRPVKEFDKKEDDVNYRHFVSAIPKDLESTFREFAFRAGVGKIQTYVGLYYFEEYWTRLMHPNTIANLNKIFLKAGYELLYHEAAAEDDRSVRDQFKKPHWLWELDLTKRDRYEVPLGFIVEPQAQYLLGQNSFGYLFFASLFFPFIETFLPAFGMIHGGWVWIVTGLIFSAIHTITEWKTRALKHGKDAWKVRVTDFLFRFVQYLVFSLPFHYQNNLAVAFFQSFEIHALINITILTIRAIVEFAKENGGLIPGMQGLGKFLEPIAVHGRLGMIAGDPTRRSKFPQDQNLEQIKGRIETMVKQTAGENPRFTFWGTEKPFSLFIDEDIREGIGLTEINAALGEQQTWLKTEIAQNLAGETDRENVVKAFNGILGKEELVQNINVDKLQLGSKAYELIKRKRDGDIITAQEEIFMKRMLLEAACPSIFIKSLKEYLMEYKVDLERANHEAKISGEKPKVPESLAYHTLVQVFLEAGWAPGLTESETWSASDLDLSERIAGVVKQRKPEIAEGKKRFSRWENLKPFLITHKLEFERTNHEAKIKEGQVRSIRMMEPLAYATLLQAFREAGWTEGGKWIWSAGALDLSRRIEEVVRQYEPEIVEGKKHFAGWKDLKPFLIKHKREFENANHAVKVKEGQDGQETDPGPLSYQSLSRAFREAEWAQDEDHWYAGALDLSGRIAEVVKQHRPGIAVGLDYFTTWEYIKQFMTDHKEAMETTNHAAKVREGQAKPEDGTERLAYQTLLQAFIEAGWARDVQQPWTWASGSMDLWNRIAPYCSSHPLPDKLDWSSLRSWYLMNKEGIIGANDQALQRTEAEQEESSLSIVTVTGTLLQGGVVPLSLFQSAKSNGPHLNYLLRNQDRILRTLKETLERNRGKALRTSLKSKFPWAEFVRASDEGKVEIVEKLRGLFAGNPGLTTEEVAEQVDLPLSVIKNIWTYVKGQPRNELKTYADNDAARRTLIRETMALPETQEIIRAWRKLPAPLSPAKLRQQGINEARIEAIRTAVKELESDGKTPSMYAVAPKIGIARNNLKKWIDNNKIDLNALGIRNKGQDSGANIRAIERIWMRFFPHTPPQLYRTFINPFFTEGVWTDLLPMAVGSLFEAHGFSHMSAFFFMLATALPLRSLFIWAHRGVPRGPPILVAVVNQIITSVIFHFLPFSRWNIFLVFLLNASFHSAVNSYYGYLNLQIETSDFRNGLDRRAAGVEFALPPVEAGLLQKLGINSQKYKQEISELSNRSFLSMMLALFDEDGSAGRPQDAAGFKNFTKEMGNSAMKLRSPKDIQRFTQAYQAFGKLVRATENDYNQNSRVFDCGNHISKLAFAMGWMRSVFPEFTDSFWLSLERDFSNLYHLKTGKTFTVEQRTAVLAQRSLGERAVFVNAKDAAEYVCDMRDRSSPEAWAGIATELKQFYDGKPERTSVIVLTGLSQRQLSNQISGLPKEEAFDFLRSKSANMRVVNQAGAVNVKSLILSQFGIKGLSEKVRINLNHPSLFIVEDSIKNNVEFILELIPGVMVFFQGQLFENYRRNEEIINVQA